MVSYLWEVFVCFLEAVFYGYLFYKRIGLGRNREKRVLISILVMTALPSFLTIFNVALFLKMTLMLVVYILVVLWTFDSRGKVKRFKALFWAATPLAIVTVADYVTYSITLAITDQPLEELLSYSSAPMQFTLIYILLVGLIVWLLTHLGERDPEVPLPIGIILFVFVCIGIFAVESMIDIALVLQLSESTKRHAQILMLLGYCILFLLFALLIAFEYLGIVLRRNRELVQQRQLAEIEEQQYQFMVSTAESLAEWKHDYKGQLRLMSALIAEENYAELKQYIAGVDAGVSESASLVFTGNRTVDAAVSLRIMDARRHQISFETKIYLPDTLPIHKVAFSSLIGNILDNAIEACVKLDTEEKKIYFEMKPWKKMLYIFCSNASDGNYVKGEQDVLLSTKKTPGHGIGLRRIRQIVEEAGGTCQFSPETNQFSVHAMIPLKETVS